jgi:acetylornithine deacetylase/succinyl-diaminopimelate desuccinylase-like protein
VLPRSLCALAFLLTAAVVSAAAESRANDIRAWRLTHEAAIVNELAGLVALPNVASDSAGIGRNVRALVAALERRGVKTEVLTNGPWPPAVFGQLRTPGAKRTLVFYAHYDGQPVTPAEWATPPWEPTLRVRDGASWRTIPLPPPTSTAALDPEARLFGRASSDDKAPIVAMLAALDALRATGTRPSVNLAFFFEGEEEAGSPHLRAILENHRDRLKADAWLFCDGPVHASRRPQLVMGARGVMGLELTAYGAARSLHSGHYGNWAPNPATLLARTIASMVDGEGRVHVEGFGADVRMISDADRAAIAALPPTDEALRTELLLGAVLGGGAPAAELVLRAAINVRGIRSGGVGEQATNSIPTLAQASIDIRMVPDQKPAKVREQIETHLTKQGWFVTRDSVTAAMRLAHPRVLHVAWDEGYAAYRLALDAPAARALRATLDEHLGQPVLVLPMLGGSLPLSIIAGVVEAPLAIVPIVNHDNSQHAKDENLRLQNLWDGIEAFAAIMTRAAAHWPK